MANREKRAATTRNKSAIFSLMRHKMKEHGKLPVLEDHDGNRFVEDGQKAEALAKYFASVFTSNNMDSLSSSSNHVLPAVYPAQRNPSVAQDFMVYPSDVLKILKGLNKSTSSTFDGIPQIVYKKCADSLCRPLSMIFNISLIYSEVPSVWKEAIITAIPKTPGSVLLSSFRPISITPPPVKVLEKLIRDKLSSFFTQNHLIPLEQHGFTAGASTITQLADSVFDWNLAINNGNYVDIIYFDLSKAFDKVNHEKLLSKLHYLGVSALLLNWLKSYLDGRHMCVKVGNCFSSRYMCTSGVPQGGVLSPLLFLAYTYDLPDKLITHPSVKVQMYADDIKVYGVYGRENQTEIYRALTQSISNMLDWATVWEIPVNLAKTSVVHLGNGPKMEYKFNGITLKPSCEMKDLGIFIDSSLNFETHINMAVRKAFSALFTICRNIRSNEASVLIKLYKAYVIPILEYGSQIWSPYKRKLQIKVERVQKAFTRILLYRCLPNPDYSHSIPSYKERQKMFKLKTLLYRRVFADLVFGFKIVRGETKLRASKYWIFRPYRRRTRNFSLESVRLNRKHHSKIYNSFFFRCSRWLQMLPANVLESPNSTVFRRRLSKIDILSVLRIPEV